MHKTATSTHQNTECIHMLMMTRYSASFAPFTKLARQASLPVQLGLMTHAALNFSNTLYGHLKCSLFWRGQ